MQVLISLVAYAAAVPPSYGPPPLPIGGGYGGQSCGPNEVLHVDGTCVIPIINKNIYLYAAPEIPPVYAPPPHIPKPQIDYNIVFVKTPDLPDDLEPIVVPPPQQKTLVYVLNKAGEIKGQEVIEVPSIPTKPEVFYINYKDGENLQLPGGLDIQTALANAAPQQGQVIGGFGSGGGKGGGFGGGGFGGGLGGGHHGGGGGGGGYA
ncbi:UNVERIFIED_CONTAM: hypothetical protein RMT77_018450 [Armadillidium vulgare]